MKTKLTFFIFLLTLILWGCDSQLEDNEMGGTDYEPNETLDLTDAVYNEATGYWMIPQNDPYTLENFQKAYNNLSSGKTYQTLTRAVTEEFATSQKLSATHYALKTYPRNEEQMWKIFQMDDIKISYIPFNYVQLADSLIEKLPFTTCSKSQTFKEISPYSVTIEDYETDEGAEEPVTKIMPILYVVWPVEKKLPEDIQYEIDYEIFLPETAIQTRCTSLGNVSMDLLENEAVYLSIGYKAPPVTRNLGIGIGNYTHSGSIRHWDNYLEEYVSMDFLKVQFILGSNIKETTTGFGGFFTIDLGNMSGATKIRTVFQDRHYILTGANASFSVYVADWGTVQSRYSSSNYSVFTCIDGVPQVNLIFRAVTYFHNSLLSHGINPIQVYTSNQGLTIKISEDSNSSINGKFSYSKFFQGYVTIYNNNRDSNPRLFGTVCHELGHVQQYLGKGYSKYKDTNKTLKESYASYVGWHVGMAYYRKYGTITDRMDITGQARQGWGPGWGNEYSPLFVDLVDDFNQGVIRDVISRVPYSVIKRISLESTNWNSCRNILREYSGIHYTSTDINDYIAIYNTWF